MCSDIRPQRAPRWAHTARVAPGLLALLVSSPGWGQASPPASSAPPRPVHRSAFDGYVAYDPAAPALAWREANAAAAGHGHAAHAADAPSSTPATPPPPQQQQHVDHGKHRP